MSVSVAVYNFIFKNSFQLRVYRLHHWDRSTSSLNSDFSYFHLSIFVNMLEQSTQQRHLFTQLKKQVSTCNRFFTSRVSKRCSAHAYNRGKCFVKKHLLKNLLILCYNVSDNWIDNRYCNIGNQNKIGT